MDKGMMRRRPQPNIAELQKEIAKQAADQKLPDAAKSADQAAKALDKGDIPKAIENQQKALEQLKQGGARQLLRWAGMPMDKKGMQMGGMPMDKNGMPMGGCRWEACR